MLTALEKEQKNMHCTIKNYYWTPARVYTNLTEEEASNLRAELIASLEDNHGLSFREADALIWVEDKNN